MDHDLTSATGEDLTEVESPELMRVRVQRDPFLWQTKKCILQYYMGPFY